MIVLGLTGSIGMGKSTAALMLKRLGCALHDADASVHRLYQRGGAAVAPIARAFPGAVIDGQVDRVRLGPMVVGNPASLRRLEAIVHPLVRRESDQFLRRCSRRRVQIAVMDVPLLFEGGGWRRVDRVLVVTAPPDLQRQRVLKRSGMSDSKFKAILAQQMPDQVKRRLADFIVPTGLGRYHSLYRLQKIVNMLKMQRGRVWPPQGCVKGQGRCARLSWIRKPPALTR